MLNDPTQKMSQELIAHGFGPGELLLLKRALCGAESDSLFEDRLSKLAIQGLIELADWILGRKRFGTITESDMNRVLKIFLEIRQDAPTLQSLTEDFGIPETRGRSMLSRMNYGEARVMKMMSYKHTAAKLEDKFLIDDKKGRFSLTVDAESLKCINDAVWEITANPNHRDKESVYKDAEWPVVEHKGTHGAIVHAKKEMWKHIRNWLKEKAEEIHKLIEKES